MLTRFLSIPEYQNPEWRRFLTRWLMVSLFLHLVAAILSTGYYHWDEHFQIYEFLNYRLGKSTTIDLPVEFRTHMRPWLQISFLAGLVKLCRAFGSENPFTWALSFRLLSSLIGWICTAGLAFASPFWVRDIQWRRWVVLGLSLMWFFPALHARASSESWGGTFFFIGLSYFFLAKNPGWLSAWISGLFFGMAFEFRYQVGLMIAGAILWLLIHGKMKLNSLASMTAGFLVAVAAGTVSDYWGYDQWVFAPYNYVRFNLLDGHINDIDTFPWWDFFRRAFTESWPPLGGLLLLAFPVAWIRNPKHLLTWSAVPFFIVHTLIGHKELRFIFPLVMVAPFYLVQCLYSARGDWPMRIWPVKILIAMNLFALIPTTALPAWMPVRFYEYVYSLNPSGLEILYPGNLDPYRVIAIPIHYYRPDHVTMTSIPNYSEIPKRLEKASGPIWVYHNGFEFKGDAGILPRYCRLEFSMLPEWLIRFNYFGIMQRMNNWQLLQCESKQMVNHAPSQSRDER